MKRRGGEAQVRLSHGVTLENPFGRRDPATNSLREFPTHACTDRQGTGPRRPVLHAGEFREIRCSENASPLAFGFGSRMPFVRNRHIGKDIAWSGKRATQG